MAESTAEFTEQNSDSGLNPDQTTAEHTRLDLIPDNEYRSTNDHESSESDSDSYEDEFTGLESDFDHMGWDWETDYEPPVQPTGWDWDPSDELQDETVSFFRVSRCVSFSKYKNSHLERGDKLIMPPSCLSEIVHLDLEFPLFFKIKNITSEQSSHCGVLEFDGVEGSIFMPAWMMNNLKIKEGDDVIIQSASLSAGTYLKLQPHATAFTELSNPKAVLENKLRDFTCLSRGDTFSIRHNNTDFYFDVLEVAPGDAVSLIETDCEVEFAPPLDYKEPEPELKPAEVEKKKEEEVKEFRPFMGRARRLYATAVTAEHEGVRAAVPEERKMGAKEEGKDEKFKPFMGRGHTLGSS